MPRGPDLALPHTDIVPNSFRLSLDEGRTTLRPNLDYLLNADEGRVRLGETALSRLRERPGTTLEASYAVPAFAPVVVPGDEGTPRAASWTERPSSAPDPVAEGGNGLLGDALDWLFGAG